MKSNKSNDSSLEIYVDEPGPYNDDSNYYKENMKSTNEENMKPKTSPSKLGNVIDFVLHCCCPCVCAIGCCQVLYGGEPTMLNRLLSLNTHKKVNTQKSKITVDLKEITKSEILPPSKEKNNMPKSPFKRIFAFKEKNPQKEEKPTLRNDLNLTSDS